MEGLNRIVEIIKELEITSSTKAKQHILSTNADNELFKKILIYTYGDYQFGIQKKTIDKMVFNPQNDLDMWNHNLFKMLEYLNDNNINNKIVSEVEKMLSYFTDEKVRELLINVLLKDLRCNINVKTINKAIPNLIFQHNVQLASKFEGELKGKEVGISLKMDGIRNSTLIQEGEIRHISRQGKTIEGLNEINEALKEFDVEGYYLDGELIRKNIDNLPSDDNFRLTTKIVNSKSNDKRGLEFVIFDIIPIEDYQTNKSTIPYSKRLELMEDIIGEGNSFIRLVPKFGVTNDVEKIYKILNKVVSEGQEGLILNVLDAPYQFKRTKSLLKVKKFKDADVLVTDILEGEGKYKGTLGKIEVQFKYKGKIYTNYIGSGFSNFEREYFWNDECRCELINKIISIKYFELSKNEKGEFGFRFGTWRGMEYIRNDKEGIDDTNV